MSFNHGLGNLYLITEATSDKVRICCGKPIVQLSGRKMNRFCSDKCRIKWWSSHLDKVERNTRNEPQDPTVHYEAF